MLVDPSPDGGAATPNLPALIAAVAVSIESDEKMPGWAVAFSGTSSRMKYKDNFWLGL